MSDTSDTEYNSLSSVDDYISPDSNYFEASGDYYTMATAISVAFSPFDPELESISEFIERFKVQCSDLLVKAGEDEKKKATVLIKALPVAVISDLIRRLKPKKLSEATYAEVEGTLLGQYETKKSIIGASVKFMSRKQSSNESIEDYAKVLNDLVTLCKYEESCRDRLLRDAFVSGLRCPKVISALLHDCEDKTFEESVERAKIIESFAVDAQNIRQDAYKSNVHKVSHLPSNENHGKFPSKKPTPLSQSYICIRCSAKGKHLASDCFALKLSCNKCKKLGHIAIACKSTKKRNVHHVEESDRYTSGNKAHAAPQLTPDPGVHNPPQTPPLCTDRCCSMQSISQDNDFDNFLG